MKINTSAITASCKKIVYRAGFTLKKSSPEILIISGVVGTIVSAVIACKATTKIGEILEESKDELDAARELVNEAGDSKIDKQDATKELIFVYARTGVKLAKLYGVAITTEAASIACIFASNQILRNRAIALAAAYTAVDQSFKEYRGRVVERFGADMDHELRYNIKAKEISETVTDEETGKKKKVKKIIQEVGENREDGLKRCFDQLNDNFQKDKYANMTFLLAHQAFANDRLISRGYLFLNDVLEDLGFERTKEGQVLGWIYDKDDPKGDNYVDFGIRDVSDENTANFLNGYEKAVWLDFNVDGPIMNVFEAHRK